MNQHSTRNRGPGKQFLAAPPAGLVLRAGRAINDAAARDRTMLAEGDLAIRE